MTRYWVSWWSGYYANEGCTKPPYQVWISGHRDRNVPGTNRYDGDRDEVSICSMIDADSEEQIWESVEKHFPDYEPRFCSAQEPDALPGSRFPGFEGKTRVN